MKILLTGANGQLGMLLQQQASPNVRLLAMSSQEMDITNMSQVQAAVASFEPDVIINAAAYTQVDKAESEPEEAFLVNQQGVENLIIATRTHTRLIHISTDFVFDGTKNTPYTPADATNPLSIYGKSKLAGEQALLEHAPDRGTVIRTAWLYAANGKNFVNTMLSLMQTRDSLRVVNDQRGTPTSAEGLAQAIWRVVARPSATGILHWTDTGETTWYGFAQEIQRLGAQYGLLQRAIPIDPISTPEYPTPAVRPAYSVLDKTDTYAKLGKTALSWQQALEQVIQKKSQQSASNGDTGK